MIKLICSALLVLFFVPTMAVAQHFYKGLAAAQAGGYATALREWTPLAEQGNADAQNNLGFMYEIGEGVPQDFVAAHTWFNLSSANGDKDAGSRRDNLAGRMLLADISTAQQRARVCMETNYQDCY